MLSYNCLFQHQRAGVHRLSFTFRVSNIFLVLCMSNNFKVYSRHCKYFVMKLLILLCAFRKAISFLFRRQLLVCWSNSNQKSQYSALIFSWILFWLCMVTVKSKTWAEFVHKNQSSLFLSLLFLGWTLTCWFLYVSQMLSSVPLCQKTCRFSIRVLSALLSAKCGLKSTCHSLFYNVNFLQNPPALFSLQC